MRRFASVAWRIGLLALIILLIIGAYFYMRPVPKVSASLEDLPAIAPVGVKLAVPDAAESALSEQRFGSLMVNGQQTPRAMASTAKIVTALAVMSEKPLTPNEQGPTITLSQADVDLYNQYYSQDGSVAKVTAGEQISEHQMLEGMLLPSANNMADSLAIWAFGSLDNYIKTANAMLASMGLANTHVVGASGFSEGSVSTAQDLTVLGQRLMANPTLAGIVGQKNADIPEAGTVQNINFLLGSNGVNGIKTGNTDQAGGCFVFSAEHKTTYGETMDYVGAIMGAPTRDQALVEARDLLNSVDANFTDQLVISKGEVIGQYKMPWDASTKLVAAEDLRTLVWNGHDIKFKAQVDQINHGLPAGASVGQVKATFGTQSKSVPIVTKQNLASPSWQWRIFR